jgi:hypothetical protein
MESWAADLAPSDGNQWSDIFALSLSSTNTPAAFNVVVLPMAAGQHPTLSWQVTPGKTYQVQYKVNLSDPIWSVLNGNVTILGTQARLTDFAASVQRFYRVVAF